MRLRFLCEEHRQRLKASPECARDLWFETADRMLGVDRVCSADRRPTPHDVSLAGSALEASHIFLADIVQCPRDLIERYVLTASHLIELMHRLGQSHLGIVVVAVATAMLEQLGRRGANRQACERACGQITLAGQRLLGTENNYRVLCTALVHPHESRTTVH
ncbi:MAG: hypothetical protein AAGL66_04575 [Pseudomonadota bacterium]